MNVAWPHLADQDRWLIDAMERRLREGNQSAEALRTRASALRDEADATDIRGIRQAKLALADCYEQAAASRLAV